MPFRPFNVTAVLNTLWVCGADEMIMASTDAGATWQLKHQNRDGEVLLNIGFVDAQIGHAAGTGGLLLSTNDGGETWNSYSFGRTVRKFAFADAANGIVVISDLVREPNNGLLDEVQGTAAVNGSMKITHDGGEHWQDALKDDKQFSRYSEVLSVAALDPSHYLVAMREPEVENIYGVTEDAGETWKRVHIDDVYAQAVFARGGEYWSFGIEYLDRKHGGGYSAPVVLHSKDGETWTHGIRGPNEFSSCNVQGCYLWDGTIEEMYGDHEKNWALPQDGSLTSKWALVESTICTVGSSLKCAPGEITEKAQPRPVPEGGIFMAQSSRDSFADRCLECIVQPFVPDPPNVSGAVQIVAWLKINPDGSVADVSLDRVLNKAIAAEITKQIMEWVFEPIHKSSNPTQSQTSIDILLMCHGWPGRPDSSRCTLSPGSDFVKPAPNPSTPQT